MESITNFILGLIGDENNPPHYKYKIYRAIRVISALLLVMPWLNNILNFDLQNRLKEYVIWKNSLSMFGESNAKIVFIIWLAYSIIISELFTHFFAWADRTDEKIWIALKLTLDEAVLFAGTGYLLLFSLNYVFEYVNGSNNVQPSWESLVGTTYLIGWIITRMYREKKNYMYKATRRYTCFFDSEGQKIPHNAFVVYNGKQYEIYQVERDEGKGKEWILSSNISLEDAARDQNGKLKLCK